MTVGRAYLFIYDHKRDRREKLRCITDLQRLTEEDSIFWFDLCGWKLTDDHDNKGSSSGKIKTPVVTGRQ